MGTGFSSKLPQNPRLLAELPERPLVSAFTATATAEVRDDIVQALGLHEPFIKTTGFDRPNLYFAVEQPTSKGMKLLQLLNERKDKSGIVYCSTRKNVEEICDLLLSRGLPATRYHAGLDPDERRENQDDFLYDRKTIMVATNAFGMGIDKSNVSFVIHYNMPKIWRATIRKPAVPVETVSPPTVFCCTADRMCAWPSF